MLHDQFPAVCAEGSDTTSVPTIASFFSES
jgi:hypothetical protein